MTPEELDFLENEIAQAERHIARAKEWIAREREGKMQATIDLTEALDEAGAILHTATESMVDGESE